MHHTHIAHPLLPHTLEPHKRLLLSPLDPEPDVDAPVQLVHLASDPRHLAGKVHLVAQQLACSRVRPQRVHRARHHRRALLLVVEDCAHRDAHDDGEDGDRA